MRTVVNLRSRLPAYSHTSTLSAKAWRSPASTPDHGEPGAQPPDRVLGTLSLPTYRAMGAEIIPPPALPYGETAFLVDDKHRDGSGARPQHRAGRVLDQSPEFRTARETILAGIFPSAPALHVLCQRRERHGLGRRTGARPAG